MGPNLERLLDNAPRFLFEGEPDPRAIIRVANALHPLGKEHALDAITRYLKKHPDHYGIFLVLRCLFDVPNPPGYMPMIVGSFSPDVPSDPHLVPRFPLVIVQDVPINLVNGYMYAGIPQYPMEHVVYFRSKGRFRTKPLAPTNHPLQIMNSLESSPQWLWGKPYRVEYPIRQMNVPSESEKAEGRSIVRCQILRLISSVYPRNLYQLSERELWEQKHAESRWQKIVSDMSNVRLKWDASQQDYIIAK